MTLPTSPARRSFLTTVVAYMTTYRHPVSAHATDCHHHIYDSRFPIDPNAQLRPPNATVGDYRLLQQLLGLTRNVVIQPSTYGLDNRCLLDALHQFGRLATRGIAVVNTQVSNSELKHLAAAGVCGIRFNLIQSAVTTIEMIEPLANRIASHGWHIQINATTEQILIAGALWNRLPIPIVFDHLAHVVSPNEPAFSLVARLLQAGKCWVKISGVYMDSKAGPPTYSDSAAIAKAYLKEAPERLVWGTDWPHPTTTDKPNDALLFDLLAKWSGTAQVWTRILVENPDQLYGFS